MLKIDSDLFTKIFHEAHVVDMDFSKWDRFVRVVVVARALPSRLQRFPVYNVDFCQLEKFFWTSNHLQTSLPRGRFCQWTIMASQVRKRGQSFHVVLPGVGPAPSLEIWCKNIRMRTMSPKAIDSLNPLWNRPYGPLARPSIGAMVKLQQKV